MSTTAIVPLKPKVTAKSRLGFNQATRAVLANAMATDLLASCQTASGIDEVIVAGTAPAGLSVTEIPDLKQGLNLALGDVLTALPPQDQVIILLGDLPCVRPEDIDLALELARARSRAPHQIASMICDAVGTGTTTLIGTAGTLIPRFGPHSRALHREQGYVELKEGELSRLRRDVDSIADLADAVRIGTGPATNSAAETILFN